jgi:DNA (cytosine-5)-methyltransferase 1
MASHDLASHGHPGIASVTHPTERRKLTIAELKRICGFPDDFVLTGSYAQQWERLGRAVPPVMMFHIAAVIRDRVLKEERR